MAACEPGAGADPVAPVAARGLKPGCSLSLYIHVPFCASKCAYCDFCSYPGIPPERIRRTVGQTARQIRDFARLLRPSAVPSVYVGGGTPSLLSPDQMSELLSAARAFGPPPPGQAAEWTVEANPESLSADWLAACREGGVNRLSLGVQSLQDPLLEALGRRATAAGTRRCLALLDRHWPQRRSADLLAGIPGQRAAELERDIRELGEGAWGHLSLYTLTPPPASKLRVDPDAADRLWLRGRGLLRRLGYRHYEVSNFARPGEECRHNLATWRLEPYLGVGPAAVGTLPTGRDGPRRLSNPADLGRFLAGRAQGWGMEAEDIGPRDFLLETLMMGLRLEEGISEASFTRRFGAGLPELLPGLWEGWRTRRLARERAGAYALTAAGRLRLNPLLVEAGRAIDSLGTDPAVCWP